MVEMSFLLNMRRNETPGASVPKTRNKKMI
jgi:hypothetical protein